MLINISRINRDGEKIMTVYHVETQEYYDALMIYFEKKGFKWLRGEKPTRFDRFKDNGKDTCVYEEDGIISFSGVEYFKKYHDNETLIEYKAKGESMTQEEMKHNLQEAVKSFARGISESEKDLQEAKTSAKKLIEKIDEHFETLKPKFKVGDYVTVYVNSKRKIAKIAKIDEQGNEKVHGLWYDQTLVNVKQDYWFASGLNEFRHATQEEIEEYKVALNFHKHGRKPFEVKEGDIILYSESEKIFVDVPSFWDKEDFTSGRYTLVKTAEEYNEWIENK